MQSEPVRPLWRRRTEAAVDGSIVVTCPESLAAFRCGAGKEFLGVRLAQLAIGQTG